MKVFALCCALLAAATPVLAKPCEELKADIAAKLDAKNVVGYTLEIVANDQAGDSKVVGSCDGGAKKKAAGNLEEGRRRAQVKRGEPRSDK